MASRISTIGLVAVLWTASAQGILIDSVSGGIQCNAAATTCFELRIVADPDFNSISWHTAAENAVALGGSLATPANMEENDILLALLAAASDPWGNVQFGGVSVGGWTGVSNNNDGAGWVNLDGSASLAGADFVYPWYLTEPNGTLPGDGFVGFVNVTASNNLGLAAGVGWADLKDFDSFFRTPSFFVETQVPEPNTLALLCAGLIGLGVARRKRVG